MDKNPLAHLQRKKNPQSFHEKFIQLPYVEDAPESSSSSTANPLETVASRKPVMIDKTNVPFNRKQVLETLARRGALTVRPSLREIPRQPFDVGVIEEDTEKERLEKVAEDTEDTEENKVDEQVPEVLEVEPVAPLSDAELTKIQPPAAVTKKLRGKKDAEKNLEKALEKELKKPTKPAKRIEKWISEKETQSAAVVPTTTQPVIHRISPYYLNNRKKFLTEINRLFSKYRSILADKQKDISCQTQQEKGAFELMTHQKVITDYLNLYSPYRGLLLYHGLGTGKCHKKDTPLLMHNGAVKMVQDVCVGDLLMGDDSKPRTVLSLANGRDAMYDIISAKGEKYTVNREHILCLKTREGKVVEITVEQFLVLPAEMKTTLKGYRVAVEFPEVGTPIHPYTVGTKLFVEKEFSSIPMLYKCNSLQRRVQFFLGLKTHSYYHLNQNAFFIPQDEIQESLLDDIVFLIRSIGLSCWKETEDRFGFQGGKVWKLAIGNELESEIAVEYVNQDEYYGFTLDGNGRYVMGDFTVTHNTCSSIALAEGMKSEKKIFVLTPASLKMNYFQELKSCGDQLYRIHQHWEFVSTEAQPERITTLSETLQLPREIIEKQKGAWMMNPSKTPNYEDLDSDERKSLDAQIEAMIRTKYEDIHYNGLNSQKMSELEARGKRAIPKGSKRKPNPFHDCVVVVDEAHNLVSRIHNQLKSVSKKTGKKEVEKGGAKAAATQMKIALKLYEWLMTAENARVILLSGTPIINYPSEIGVMFNILRGVIKTWTFPLKVETQTKVDKEYILKLFERAGLKTYDYVAYGRNELVVTRNPFGFVNRTKGPPTRVRTLKNKGGKAMAAKTMKHGKKMGKKMGDKGVEIAALPPHVQLSEEELDKELESAFQGENLHAGGGAVEDDYDGMERSLEPLMSDEEFERTITDILNSNGLKVEKSAVRVQTHLLLPDNQEEFLARFVDIENGSLKNEDTLKRRILGLTSYFRSAQEKLMPSFVLTSPVPVSSSENMAVEDISEEEAVTEEAETEETEEIEEEGKQMGGMITTNRIYHLVKTPMSSYQFGIYEKIRKEEANQEKNRRKRAKNQKDTDNDMETLASSYRIFSRVACNFVFPPPGRPMPPEKEGEKEEEALPGIAKKGLRKGGVVDWDSSSDDDDLDKEGGKKDKKKSGITADKEAAAAAAIVASQANTHGGAPKLNLKSVRAVSMMEVGDDEEILDDDLEAEEGNEEGVVEDSEKVKETTQKAYQRAIQAALALLKNNGNKFLSLEALKETYSPKMAAMIERLQDPENRGLHLIYSQFRSLEGIQIMKLALEQNGWAEFRIQRGSGGDWEIDWEVERHGEWKTNTKPCFVLYTGTETAEVKEIIRNIYNGRWTVVPATLVESLKQKGEDNRMGEVIKAFMITSSGAEGISLTNTRFVHIMEPYWNLIRLEQVIGRARRICSHEALPVELRTVKVFLYLAVLSDEQKTSEKHIELRIRDVSRFDYKTPVTTDEYLLEVALLKDSINRQILRAVQSTAIDCSLYSDAMNEMSARSGEEALVCYGFGRVNSNAFSTYPTLEEDMIMGESTKANERREKVAVVEFKYNGEEYVKNLKNGEIYTRANYNRGLETGEDLVVVGNMVRGSDGKERVVLEGLK